MITWAGDQPRWAEFEQGRPQKNRLQTFPEGCLSHIGCLGIHMAQPRPLSSQSTAGLQHHLP